MFRPGSDFFQRRWRVRAPGLLLAAGLSLTLVDVGNGASGDPEAATVDTISSVSAVPPVADAPSPPANGASLTGTVLATQSADARAIITDGRGRQRVYANGAEIADGGEVVEIHRDYVVLRRDGRLERLEFSWNAVARMFERAPPSAAQVTPPEDSPEALRHKMFTDPALLLQLVGATAVVESGQFRGYRVMQPEDSTFLESLGLKPGDILTGVNGVPFTPDYGVKLFDAMSETGKLTYTVQRGGQVLILSDN